LNLLETKDRKVLGSTAQLTQIARARVNENVVVVVEAGGQADLPDLMILLLLVVGLGE